MKNTTIIMGINKNVSDTDNNDNNDNIDNNGNNY
jgi:hypothetical protein